MSQQDQEMLNNIEQATATLNDAIFQAASSGLTVEIQTDEINRFHFDSYVTTLTEVIVEVSRRIVSEGS